MLKNIKKLLHHKPQAWYIKTTEDVAPQTTEKEVCNLGSNKIAEIRKKKGLTQAELALRLGIDRTHLSKVENGKNTSTHLLMKIAKELGVSMKDFF